MTENEPTAVAWRLSDEEPASMLWVIEKRLRVQYARQLELVAEADRRGLGRVTRRAGSAAHTLSRQRPTARHGARPRPGSGSS